MKIRFEPRLQGAKWRVYVGMIRVAGIWRRASESGHVVMYEPFLDDNWTADEWFQIHDAIERKVVALDVALRISS